MSTVNSLKHRPLLTAAGAAVAIVIALLVIPISYERTTGYDVTLTLANVADPSQIGSTGLIVYHYTLPKTEINDWLVEQHKAAYNDVPDLFTECGFASAQAIVAGVTATEGSTVPEDLIPALEGLTWEGPKGTYTMRAEDHQALMPMYVVKLVNLDSPDQAYYELVAEVSAEDAAPPCESGADRSSETLDCTPLAERAQ